MIEEVWQPVRVQCLTCGSKDTCGIVQILSSRQKIKTHCFQCSASEFARQQRDFFSELGLVKESPGYTKASEPVSALCSTCGAKRKVSLSDLNSGAPPCLSCQDGIDPALPHLVYLVHFPTLEIFKIGITNTEDRRYDRLTAHLKRGAILVDHQIVSNREAALTTEKYILDLMSDYRHTAPRSSFPQGGWTETWHDSAPEVSLREIIRHLEEKQEAGFDRMQELQKYFDDTPPTIEEIRRFVAIRDVIVDDSVVHVVELSTSHEDLLRRVRAKREQEPTDNA
ncbi:hypothetical protein [Amycolatopsis oliviviridis]|uniref:hypothetical protein n=1 Tax=Amycolatopsis oliviviridis TaxID=1471590 RepID=UPI00174DD273|nr:hypothetical protein [Amycolatopsis oliviviridis]